MIATVDPAHDFGAPHSPPVIAAREIPELRASLLDWLDFFVAGSASESDQVGEGREVSSPDVLPISTAQRDALRTATLFSVSPDMVSLVVEAAASLPEYRLHPEDVPSETGLCSFQAPIACSPQGEPVMAISWGPGDEGVWLRCWSYAPGEPVHQLRPRPPWAPRHSLLPCWDLLLPWHEGPEFALRDNEGDDRTYLARRIVTTWLLMGETFISDDTVVPDRSARRRLETAGDSADGVRVLSLRREPGRAAQSGAGGHRDYRHRWIVRGHWRQQWYPSRHEHRPRWIAPHLKGPDDKPLAGGERVYLLRR